MAKSPSKVKGKKKKRPKFCPNSSKNSALNASQSGSRRFEVEEELKKNNADLAKALNQHKSSLAQLFAEKQSQEAEMMELKMELSQLRALQDPGELELEVQRRLREEKGRLEQDLRAAVDHTLGLSSILGRLVASSSQSRQSLLPAAAKRGSDVGGMRMRQVVPGKPCNTWASSSSPPRQLSKVPPMVAGHAISRPRIQLARMDLSSVQLPSGQEEEEDAGRQTPNQQEVPAIIVDETEEATPENSPTVDNLEDEDIEPTPPQPAGRNPFDLTNIREESTFLEDSVLSTMEETLVTPNMEVLPEENLSEMEEERPALLTSTTLRQSTRLSMRPQIAEVLSPSAGSSPLVTVLPPDVPGTSPYVLAQDVSHSSFLTESFLEQMVDIDPTEGPSWLFASVKKKKKRRTASKKLTAIFSDLDVSTSSTADTSGNVMLVLPDNLESPAVDREENQENEESEQAAAVPVREPSDGARTPLSPLSQHRDESGHLVNIREPRIMLSNVGIQGEALGHSPLVKGKRTLDELFSLVRNSSPSRQSKRKCSSDPHSELHSRQVGAKKARCTDLPVLSDLQPRLQELEVRLEKVEVTAREASDDSGQTEGGRRRRNRSQVSYKEPSLGKKLRQGDKVSNITYHENFKTEMKKKTKKPKIKNPSKN